MRPSMRTLMLCAPFLSMALLTVWRVQCRVPPLPLDTWDIPQLVDHLDRAGLELRSSSVAKDGPLDQALYLTVAEQDWHYLNKLIKDPKRIHEWRGIVYCERRRPHTKALYLPECGQYTLEVGPFFFFRRRRAARPHRRRPEPVRFSAAALLSPALGKTWE